MTCPNCAERNVELPEPGHPAWCPDCDSWFRKVDEDGWFTYAVEIYVPMVKGES